MTEASLLSQKLHKFGVLGAGVIPDSLATIKYAEAAEAKKDEPATEVGETALVKKDDATSSARGGYVPAEMPKIAPGETPTRQQILDILEETIKVQGVVQQEVSLLARRLAKEKGDKKKRKALSFVDGHKKIQDLGLPREPLEDVGLSESTFQQLLQQYEEDAEVMACAQKLLHPVGKGDVERARRITMDKILEIHQFMVAEMQKVLQEFLQLPMESRKSFTGKGCETTAELLVSIAVEQRLEVRCEDVEQAVVMYEEQLQSHPEFSRCTEQLANMMQCLIGAAQPRVEKEEFLKILNTMADSTKKVKAFAKKLYEDYRGKSCTIAEAYKRFEDYMDNLAPGADLPELSTIEMQLCHEEYRDDPEVRKAWESSGAETNILMQAMIGGPMPAKLSDRPEEGKPLPTPKGAKKAPKPSEFVEMQELMVDELKRTTEAAEKAAKNAETPWKAELVVQMVQALASAAVERRYGISAEEMTVAGFQLVQTLHKNERFVRATEKQQEILMQISKMCGVTSASSDPNAE